MIRLGMLPCFDCKFYKGIKQPNKSEIGEYVRCDIAKNKNAEELVYIKDKKYLCDKYESE